MKTPICLVLLIFFSTQLCKGQAELWGVTSGGGTSNLGIIFKANVDGTAQTVQYNFLTSSPGAYPVFTKLTEATNGKLYGVTQKGGTNGSGVLFEFDPSTSAYKVILEFAGANGTYPTGSLTLAPNGKLYGLTQGTYNGGSVLFAFDPVASTYSKIADLNGATGGGPQGSLSQASNGKLYAMTPLGGTSGKGTLLEFDPTTNLLVKIHDFDGVGGASPTGSDILQASNGKLYGMTSGGGVNNMGVLFEYNLSSNVYSKKIDFDGTSGFNPQGSLVEFSDGKLYGMSGSGGANFGGVLFAFDPSSGTLQNKIDLDGTSGGTPYGSLMIASNNKMYAMTLYGGANQSGALFEYDPVSNAISAKVNFNYSLGNYPLGSLMQASNGNLYGMTSYGGENGDGVIFEYSISSSTYTKKFDLDFAPDGSRPSARMAQFYNGKLYGITGSGGLNGFGVLFEVDPTTKTYTKKIDFDGLNGSFPSGRLTLLKDKFYGTTYSGGKNNNGVLFQYDPTSNVISKLFDFDRPTGAFYSNLEICSDGNLYGITENGGVNNKGVIFKFDPVQNIYSKLFDFDDVANGADPHGALTQGADGKLYGMTISGGANNYGVLFSFDPSNNSFQKKVDFSHDTGIWPRGDLQQAANGKFYGLTFAGGTNDQGTLFEYDPIASSLTKKFDFDYASSGGFPFSSLVQSSNGKLYGMAGGGTDATGVLFEFDPTSGVFTKKLDFNGSNGANPAASSLTLVKQPQVITFNAIGSKTYGDLPFILSATSSAGLQISYTSSDPTIASINGSEVTMLKAGVVTITARQSGDANTFQALDVSQTLTINKADQTITFGTIPDKQMGDSPFTLSATASSGLDVAYTAQSGKVALSGSQASIMSAGRETILAAQAGNISFNEALSISQSFCISPAKPIITQVTQPSGSSTLTSSAQQGNQWYFNGSPISGATANTFAAKEQGDYKVRVMVDDCVSEFSETVSVVITGDIESNDLITVYPNPSFAFLFIKGADKLSESNLIDVMGRQHAINLTREENFLKGDVNHLSSGVYVLKIINDGNPYLFRFVKQ